MVRIRPTQSNFSLRRGPGGSGIAGFLASIPFLSGLSPIDRIIALLMSGLFFVGFLAYTFLISDFFSGDAIVAGGGGATYNDPRLSHDLRKTGLSEQALLRRGGGKRINTFNPMDNALALDVISTLHCDRVQEELEEQWQKALVAEAKRKKMDKEYDEQFKNNENGGGEVEGYKIDDFTNRRRRLDEMEEKGGAGGSGVDSDKNGDGAEGEPGDEGVVGADFPNMMDEPDPLDYDMGNGGGFDYHNPYDTPKVLLTARHLFCLAADALSLPTAPLGANEGEKPEFSFGASDALEAPTVNCDVNSLDMRESLLNLWSSARAQISDVTILERTLDLAHEHKETLRGIPVHLWYPDGDKGTEGMLKVLNSGYEGREKFNFDAEAAEDRHDDLYRFWDLPSKFVGPEKLFVDVGSALGLTSMLVASLYPRTTVVSIEPAAPSWLLQQINFRCNLNRDTTLPYVHSVLAGVGAAHHEDGDTMTKMLWRPSMTTATRTWSSQEDINKEKDIELVVKLRTLRSVLAEATPDDLPLGTPISVMNLDCEGCEYNLVPSMHETSFRSIGVLLGRTNWGFIPTIKKPSSERGRSTHGRVCSHYNFAKRCKECCDFPELEVKPRWHDGSVGGGGENAEGEESEGDAENDGEGQESPKVMTKGGPVSEVAGPLCDGFAEWASDNKLHDIPDDYGWDEMSAWASDLDNKN